MAAPEATPAAADRVKMRIDDTACIAGGQCEMLEPSVFEIDDDDAIGKVIGAGMLDRTRALELIDRCPSGAISMADEEE